MSLMGLFYASLSLICLSVVPVFMKKLSVEMSSMNIIFTTSFFTMLMAGIVLLFNDGVKGLYIFSIDYSLLIFALIVSCLFFIDLFSYSSALKAGMPIGILLGYIRAGATVLTALLGIWLFKEKLTFMQWVGVALSCVGVICILAFSEENA